VLVNNRNRSYPQKVFEIGEVVIPDNSSDVLSTNILKMSVVIAHSEASFMEIKQILNYLMSILNLECSLKETVHGTFIEGRTGQICVNDEDIGIIGEIHPMVLKNISITVPVVAFEIDLSKLFEIINS
jgi:phenylalanyl-tRNA synthetase beta chain